MKTNFRDDIQGLRALAVMLVVIYHSGIDLFPGGYIGVDVFFVISGFLIAGSLIRELETSGTISLLNFYARRARRLLPAAVFVLIVVIVVFRSYYSPLELKQFSSSAIATATYLSNFWFAHLATDYLAHNSNPNPLLHTWSLSVEEQFYFIWPFLLLAFYKIASEGKTRSLIAGTIVISLVSFIGSVALTSYAQPWAFFICLTRFWEFGLGALTAVYLQKRNISSLAASNIGASLGLMLIIVPAFTFSSSTPFPSGWALVPVTGTCLLLLFVSRVNTAYFYNIFANTYTKFIGDISYSLYLWHWPVFVLLAILGLSNTLSMQVAGVLISIVLAIATYYAVENPIRFAPIFSKGPSFSFILAGSLTCLALICGYGTRLEATKGLQEPVQKRLREVRSTLPQIYADDCHASFFATEAIPCEYGSPEATKTIVLFGDSHAAHWFPALHTIALNHNWRLITFTKSSCPSIAFEPFANHLGRQYTECTTWRNEVFEKLKIIQPDKIIISNSYDYARAEGMTADAWSTATTKTLEQIENSSGELFFIRDTPKLVFDAPTCLSRAYWQGKNPQEICSYNIADTMLTRINTAEIAAIKLTPTAQRVDLTDAICNEKLCQVEREPHVLFADDNHLTVEFVKSLVPKLENLLVFDLD